MNYLSRNLLQLSTKRVAVPKTSSTNMLKHFLYKDTASIIQRSFSSGLASIDPSKLDITTSDVRKILPQKEDLVFGQVFTDHMLEVDWSHDQGWHAPIIKPYGPMQIDPAASVLHYGLECFEGMKAYKGMLHICSEPPVYTYSFRPLTTNFCNTSSIQMLMERSDYSDQI